MTVVRQAETAQTLPPPIGARLQPSDLNAHRAAMLRFARRKIRDADLAEDAVQDALLAALASGDSFKGESALRTWLIGILNHKIQDTFRRELRYVRQEANDGGSDASGNGWNDTAWERQSRPEAIVYSDDSDPFAEVARRHMRDRLITEIEALPPTLKDVFTMQALDGVATEEVCRRLDISEANCWVRLHRARKRLAQRMSDHLS